MIDVPATTYTDYTLPLTNANGGATGTHTIKVEFLNNFKTANGRATATSTSTRSRSAR